VGVVIMAAAALGWPVALGGASSVVVVSGDSMQPTFSGGDLLYARAADRYRVGDVVVFGLNGAASSLVVHRVIDIDEHGDFVTRGDNRSTADGFAVDAADVVGSVRFRAPGVAGTLRLLSQPWTLAILCGAWVGAYVWAMAAHADPTDAS
jgi:signal peptidase